MYFTVVLLYGLVALVIAVPLGVLAANVLRHTIMTTLGLKAADWIILPGPILSQIGICLLAPLLVAAVPVMQGARVTIREAISSYGLSGGGGWIDGTLARVRGLPRVVSLALSDAFRNRGRVFATQLALAGAGLTFMAVMSVRAALIYTLGGVILQTVGVGLTVKRTPTVNKSLNFTRTAATFGRRRPTRRRDTIGEQLLDTPTLGCYPRCHGWRARVML